jgi:hypothetical protein
MAIKTFTTGEVLTAADTNTYLANSGLTYIKEVTVGTGVSTVSISNCFSTTYDNYRIVYSAIGASASAAIWFRVGAVSSANYFGNWSYIQFSSTSVTWNAINASTQMVVGLTDSGGAFNFGSFDLSNPFKTNYKFLTGLYSGRGYTGSYGCSLNVTSSETGCTFLPESGTLTGGTITVYGYRKA